MKKGFTLLELMVSIAVIGILISIGFKGYSVIITKAKANQLVDQLNQFSVGMAEYFKDTGTYPTNLSYLINNPNDTTTPTGYDAISLASGNTEDSIITEYWKGPYLDNIDISSDNTTCLLAKTGNNICFGANITKAGAVGSIVLTNSSIGQDPANNTEAYHVLKIDGLEVSIAKEAFKIVNGKDVSSLNYDGGSGNTNFNEFFNRNNNWIIGMPNPTEFNLDKTIIYKFRNLY